jgi:hypothetical protein
MNDLNPEIKTQSADNLPKIAVPRRNCNETYDKTIKFCLYRTVSLQNRPDFATKLCDINRI